MGHPDARQSELPIWSSGPWDACANGGRFRTQSRKETQRERGEGQRKLREGKSERNEREGGEEGRGKE